MKHIALTILTAGAFATLAFDTFGQALAPLFGYAKLASVGLVGATLNTLLGANPAGAAYLLHILTGLIVYAAGCFCRPARPTCGPPIAALGRHRNRLWRGHLDLRALCDGTSGGRQQTLPRVHRHQLGRPLGPRDLHPVGCRHHRSPRRGL